MEPNELRKKCKSNNIRTLANTGFIARNEWGRVRKKLQPDIHTTRFVPWVPDHIVEYSHLSEFSVMGTIWPAPTILVSIGDCLIGSFIVIVKWVWNDWKAARRTNTSCRGVCPKPRGPKEVSVSHPHCTPGRVLPYIAYTGTCRPTGSWFWTSWFRTGYPFQRRFLERGMIFRTHETPVLWAAMWNYSRTYCFQTF